MYTRIYFKYQLDTSDFKILLWKLQHLCTYRFYNFKKAIIHSLTTYIYSCAVLKKKKMYFLHQSYHSSINFRNRDFHTLHTTHTHTHTLPSHFFIVSIFFHLCRIHPLNLNNNIVQTHCRILLSI